jgi:hypothetical protein
MERKTERDVEGGRKSEEEAEDVQVRQRQVCQTRQGEWDEEALDTLFNETIRFSVVNSYVSAITELYVWQTQSEGKPVLPLRGAKLSAVLESVRRDEDRIRRVNFIDRPVHRHERARSTARWSIWAACEMSILSSAHFPRWRSTSFKGCRGLPILPTAGGLL